LTKCHNDPNPDNFIKNKNGKIFLIDWEYAGNGDPMWDLAYFSTYHNLTDNQESILMLHYWKNNIDASTLARYHLWKPITQLIFSLWTRMQICFNNLIRSSAEMIKWENSGLKRSIRLFENDNYIKAWELLSTK
jgi:thiamine kinase-like enzyme